MSAVVIRPVAGRRDRESFIRAPFALYRDDPHWVPPLLMAERALLDERKNPFFAHATMQSWLALRDNVVVGRIAAIDDLRHNEVQGENLGFFGFFEADAEDTALALLAKAERWLKQRGRNAMRGPVNPSLNDTAGLLVDGFDSSPVFMMPYNPPSYPGWVEAAGLEKAKDLWAWWFDMAHGVNERAQRIIDRMIRRADPPPVGRIATRASFARDMDAIHRIFSRAWVDNWGFVAPSQAEFRQAAKDLKMLVDWQLVRFIEVEGETVAFSLTMIDINQIFKRLNGRLLPFGPIHLMRRAKTVKQGRVMLLGVLPEHRNKGFELKLIADSIREAQKLGWHGGECGWTLEDNHGINKAIELVGGRHYKTYRLYQKALA